MAATVWLVSVVAGLCSLWAYDNRPGEPAHPPAGWPAKTSLSRHAGRPTILFFAHPQCPCTRASLAELAEVLARTATPPTTYVVFVKPPGVAPGWEQGENWRLASALPNAVVRRDDDGLLARAFGATTSGQSLLYSTDGGLLFSGGLTVSRGHAGDNPGRTALVSFINTGSAERSATSVFGCPLFTPGS